MDNMDLNIQNEIEEQQGETIEPQSIVPEEPQYFIKHPKGKVLGGFMEFWGFSLAAFFCVLLIGVIALDIALQGVSLLLIPMIVISGLIVVLFWIGVYGRRIRSRAKRFKKYVRILAGREFCDIEELAETMEQSPEYVAYDLRDMIERGWFLQGHVDAEDKHLIITDTMYEQYTLAMSTHRCK